MNTEVNNDVYDTLADRWYVAQDDPVALLRAESRWRNPWVAAILERHFAARDRRSVAILDIGCGGGLLSNSLAAEGYAVTGLDAAPGALEVARRWDRTQTVDYRTGDALKLPFPKEKFQVVCLMDFLEHIPVPEKAVREAARVLAPEGLLFYHTFNRNWVSGLVAAKGVEWFVRNTPPRMHLKEWFIKPEELATYLQRAGLEGREEIGSRPVIDSAFFQLLLTGVVPKRFRFRQTKSTRVGYLGYAQKKRGPLSRAPYESQ